MRPGLPDDDLHDSPAVLVANIGNRKEGESHPSVSEKLLRKSGGQRVGFGKLKIAGGGRRMANFISELRKPELENTLLTIGSSRIASTNCCNSTFTPEKADDGSADDCCC
ncbi:hypothetical protein HPP92_018395 [Vanilla planifolia]|uniref:Uncharacterized protein n=1 Tax=Vanilla planifolia TaxID=51239 RepID=A0A835QHF1_VANPL|nr:hypothetical protein HPP92_018395 [Vanilla planifolia]